MHWYCNIYIYLGLSIWVLPDSLMQSVNVPQFLDITPLFLSANRFATLSAPAQLIVVVPLTSMHSSLKSHITFVLNLVGWLVLFSKKSVIVYFFLS